MTPERLQRLESGRWWILRAVVDGGDSLGLTPEMVRHALLATTDQYDEQEIEREAAYLEGKGLVRVERHPVYPLRITATSEGRDLREYVAADVPGILRPPP